MTLDKQADIARLAKVHERLGKTDPESIDCLIIYPLKNGHADLDTVNLILEPMDNYKDFYKLVVSKQMQ